MRGRNVNHQGHQMVRESFFEGCSVGGRYCGIEFAGFGHDSVLEPWGGVGGVVLGIGLWHTAHCSFAWSIEGRALDTDLVRV